MHILRVSETEHDSTAVDGDETWYLRLSRSPQTHVWSDSGHRCRLRPGGSFTPQVSNSSIYKFNQIYMYLWDVPSNTGNGHCQCENISYLR